MMGWICAVCGASNGPMLLQCPCSKSAAAATSNAPLATDEQVLGSGSKTERPATKKRFQYKDPDFLEFWDCYPRKVGKEAAAKAYRRVIDSGAATAAEVLEAAQRYRNDPNRDPSKTKYPQGWLNDGRWMDEPAEVSHPAAAVADVDFEADQRRRWSEEDESIAKELLTRAPAAAAFLAGDEA